MRPILFTIWGAQFDSYFTIISIALMISVLYALKRGGHFLKEDHYFLDLCIVTILSIYLGGRLFHVLLEVPSHYFENPLDVFKFHHGGFVIYGSFMFSVIFGYLFMKIKKMSQMKVADALSPVFMLGLGIGRFACFLNGCCFGKETNSIFGMIFPFSNGVYLHPTQLYMIVLALVIWICLLILEKSSLYFPGLLFSFTLIFHPIGRFLIEFFRSDFRGISIGPLSLSQFISIIFINFGVIVFITQYRKHKHT